MDETVIVIMIKEKSTGFFEKELTSCRIDSELEKYLLNAYAVAEDGEIFIHLKLTVDGDFTDEEFNDIYDCYDDELYENAEWEEVDDCHNPTWELIFRYKEQGIEEMIDSFLSIHKQEISEIFGILSI